MELVVNPAQPFAADVGVDLGRRDLAVPEHQLDGPEVGPALEEVRREGVPQDVRADLGGDPGRQGVPLQEFPKPLARERAAAAMTRILPFGSSVSKAKTASGSVSWPSRRVLRVGWSSQSGPSTAGRTRKGSVLIGAEGLRP